MNEITDILIYIFKKRPPQVGQGLASDTVEFEFQ